MTFSLQIPPLDPEAMARARERQAQLAKPPGSLGRLETLSVQMAGITGRVHNEIQNKHLLVFAADNGVVAEGVASTPQSVTWQQTVNLTRGKTGAAVLCNHFGCRLTVCDVGVATHATDPLVLNRKIAFGTENLAHVPAMTRAQAEQAIQTGYTLASETDADVLGIGEMGIGNTTTASAVLSVLLDVSPETVTGRGGGLDNAGLERKKDVIRNAIALHRPDRNDVPDVLSKVGGLDIAAMCGAFLGTAATRRPVVIDGFISAVAALCAVRICPNVQGYLIPSHASPETGYRLAMEALGLTPLLPLEMRLGEGSGCPLAFEILGAACAALNHMATFAQAGIDDGYLDSIRTPEAFAGEGTI